MTDMQTEDTAQAENTVQTQNVTVTDVTIAGDPKLAAYVVKPNHSDSAQAVVLCHGLPSKQRPGVPNSTYRRFAERIALSLGWTVLAVSMRGCGDSEGDFSIAGWINDIGRCVDYILAHHSKHVWLVGSTTGGSIAMLAAARDERVSGVVAMAPRADFDDWAGDPRRFLEHCRSLEIVTSPSFPPSLSSWTKELRENRPIDAAAALGERPLLILHGVEDRQVPVNDAKQLAQSNPGAELRLIFGANHRIRHDPRANAVMLGWLESHGAAAGLGLATLD